MANSSESRRDTRIKPTPVDTEMESLGLSSVPGFERPMSSGPGDRWTFEEDELGNKIYETPSGQRYTIKLNPDQRTTRTKVEDFIKDVRENGLRLPSKEQLVDVAKQVPKAVYESMAGSVRGEGTIGDVVGMAPTVPLVKSIAAPKIQAFGKNTNLEPLDIPEEPPQSAPTTRPTTLVNNPDSYNPKYNPLVVPYDSPPLTPTIEFYNPLETTISNMDFGKKGLTGETIAAFIEKRAPSVRTSLIRGTSSGRQLFDPKKRYTQEEALKIIQDNTWKISVNETSRYKWAQRQSEEIWGPEESYTELVLQANNPNKRIVPVKSGHYESNTLAHTRLSTRVDEDGQRFILVEELQSDLLQGKDKGFIAPEPRGVTPETPEERSAVEINTLFNEIESLSGTGADTDSLMFELKDRLSRHMRRHGVSAYDWDDRSIEDIIEEDGHYKVLQNILADNPNLKPNNGIPPVDSITEVVRPLVLSIMRHAQNEGMDTIVFPPLSHIIHARRGEGVSPEALKQTYETSLKKILKELERERGVEVSLYKKEVPSADLEPPLIQTWREADIPDTGVTQADFIDPNGALSLEEAVEFYRESQKTNLIFFRDSLVGELEIEKRIYEEELSQGAASGFLTDEEVDLYTRELDARNRNLARVSRPEYISELEAFINSDLPTGNLPTGDTAGWELIPDPSWRPSATSTAFVLKVDSLPDGRIRFAKGGEVKKDPVSGNDIPPGGTAKGVRDDVPALLSEGEYVIPENVVSALGPKAFDKLVKETNDMLKTQPGNVQKMAEGGFVENPTEADIISTFNPDNYRTVGFSYFGSPTSTSTQVSYTYVTYVNASGDTIQIRVDANGNPIDPVPAGYVPSSQANTLQPREEGNTTQDQPDDFTSYYTYDEEQFQQMLEDPSGLEKAMMDLLGGGVFGSLIEQDRITNLEAAAVIANDLGYTDTAQELLEKSQALAAEAGEPSGMGKWLSADAANVVDRHRDAAPTGLLETLTLTPVEPGKPISLDGRTPPPEAFAPTAGTFTAPPNPSQLPLGTDVTQLPPTTPPPTTQGTTISPNDPSFGGVIQQSTLPPPAAAPAPVSDAYQGKSIVPADPRNAYSVWSQTDDLTFMPEEYNRNPTIPQSAPFKQQTPDVAGFQPPTAGTVPTAYSTVDNSPAGRSAVGPSYPGYIPASTITPGPLPAVTPPPPAPTAPAPVTQVTPTTYYGSDPRLNTPVGSIPPAPTSVLSVAPTQPQVPTLVEQYIPGIDQGVTTKPTMPGELVTSPVPQAPSVGAAPAVNTQPPAPSVQQANPISNVYYYDPIQSVPPSVSDYVPNLSNTTVQSVSEKAFVQPTLETPTTVPVAGKTLGYPPTSGDNPPPPQQPPVPPGTTTANLAGAQVPAGTAGAVIPKDATAVSMTEEGLSSERVGLQVMSTPSKGNPAKVIGMDGKAYEVPVGGTVVIDGQTVSYNGGDKVTINGLEGVVGDIYPSTHFVNSSGQQPAPTQPTEPTVSQKNVTPTPKPAETSWISQTSLTLQEPDKVTQVSVDRYANNNADLVNAAKNAANQYGIPEELFLGLITQESQWNANAVSPAGAQGLTQVMPATATQPGYGVTPLQNWSVAEQLRFGAEYLNAMYQEFGNWEDALKAYNQGVGTTNSGTLTSEAAKYVPQVFQAADEWAKYEEEIKKYVPEEYASFDQTTGRTDYSNLDYGDLVSTGGDGDSGDTSSKTPTPTPTTTDLTTLSFGDTVTQPTGGGNVAPIEDYDSGGNQPFAKGGLVKRRAAKYSKGGLVKRRVMATRK